MNLRDFSLLLVLLAALVPGATPVAGAADPAKAARLANTVILDEAGVRNLRLQWVEAEEQTFEETVFALGRIEVIPERRAAVSSRIAGRVVQWKAVVGGPISKGDVVALIESRQPGDPPPMIPLTSPADGLVTEAGARLGDPVEPDRPLLEVTDLSEVFAVAQVPEHQAGRMQVGAKARIRVSAVKDEEREATLLRFGTATDRSAGTVDAVFRLANPGLALRPGMRAEFGIVTARREGVMSVPRSALQGDPANRFLFVADDGIAHAFVKVPVDIGVMNDRFVEITRGLFPGDKVVVEGAYSLAFAGKGSVSLKEALDAAHGHEHNEDGSELSAESRAGVPAAGKQHDHDAHAAAGGLSALTWFSLIGNAVLLVLLALAARQRGTTPRTTDAAPQPKRAKGGPGDAE